MEMQEQVKIWQRIRPGQLPVTDGIQPLAAGALADVLVYDELGRQLQGSAKDLVMQLRQQQIELVRCLKGVYRMITGEPMQISVGNAAVESAEGALRKCYGHTLKMLSFCESRSGDREYGAVFGGLTRSAQEQGRKILELTGLLPV